MSGITLSASVRQNLLSLQSTTDLLSQTQERLSTGNKVNSALDNPTNYFTASSLNNRASDISNLLDGIGNGVQVLQAANTGITSLQSLISSAQSVANQALQATSGYSTKSQFVSSALTGATASDILGATTTTPAAGGAITAGTFSTVDVSGAGTAATAGSLTAGSFASPLDVSGTGSAATGAAAIDTSGFSGPLDVSTGGGVTFSPEHRRHRAHDRSSPTRRSPAYNADAANTANQVSASSALTVGDIAKLVNYQFSGSASSGPASVNGSELELASSATGGSSEVAVTGLSGTPASGTFGLSGATHHGSAAVAASALSFDVKLDSGSAHTDHDQRRDPRDLQHGNNSSALITDTASSLTRCRRRQDRELPDRLQRCLGDGSGGALTFTSASTGTGSTVTITEHRDRRHRHQHHGRYQCDRHRRRGCRPG